MDYKCTPLIIVVMDGEKEMTRLLLDYGADPKVVDTNGIAALKRARRYETLENRRWLRKHEAIGKVTLELN
jgi:ankyrin repeat protein